MSRRSAVVVLVSAYFLFGASVVKAEQPGNQDEWKEVIQHVNLVQLYILRFSPLLLAVAMVAICGTLGAIWSAIARSTPTSRACAPA